MTKNTLKSCTVSIENLDLSLLRKQKSALLNVLGKDGLSNQQINALEGILGLIDGIQDKAMKENNFTEHEIFNL